MLQFNLSDSTNLILEPLNKDGFDTIIQPEDTVYSSFDSLSLIEDSSVNKNTTESLFTTKDLIIEDLSPKETHPLNIDWVTIHLIIAVGLLAWVRAFYNKRLKVIALAFLSERNFSLVSREGNLFKERIAIPLLIIYLISMSMFIYQICYHFKLNPIYEFEELKLFSLIMIIVLFYWVFKYLLIYFLGTVFKNYALALDYQLTNFIFTLVMGIIMLPVVVIVVYFPSSEVLYFGIILIGLSFLYRVGREVLKGFIYTKFSTFYKLLYLCTFEILPIIVFTKLVMSVLI